MGVNSLPETVTRQRRDCDLNPGPSAPESSTLTTRLPSHPLPYITKKQTGGGASSRRRSGQTLLEVAPTAAHRHATSNSR